MSFPMYFIFLEKEVKKKTEIKNAYKIMAQDDEYLQESKEIAELGMNYFLADIADGDK